MSIFRKYIGPSFLCASMSDYGSRKRRLAFVNPGYAHMQARFQRVYRRYGPRGRRSSRKNQGMKAGLMLPRNRYPTTLSWHGMGPFPENFVTTLRYSYRYNVTAAQFYDWKHRGNSIFDPDAAVGGESIMGITALAAMYTRYHVLGSGIKVTVVNNDTDDPVTVTVYPTETTASYTAANGNSVMSIPNSKTITVANQQGQGQIYHYASTRKVFGLKAVNDVGFQAAFGSDPTHIWYWHIVINNHHALTDLACVVLVQIDYRTVCGNHYAMLQT